jgi:hypothetical protein
MSHSHSTQAVHMTDRFNHTQKSAASRARRIRGRNGGFLTPFRPGEGQRVGYQKPAALVQTLALARAAAPDAMQTLIRCLNDPDSRTSVVAANSILERVFGKPREQPPEERHEASIDLSALSGSELGILLRLIESGRLRPTPDALPPAEAEIEGVVQEMDGAQHER